MTEMETTKETTARNCKDEGGTPSSHADKMSASLLFAVLLIAALPGLLAAQDQPNVQITAKDSTGAQVKVPQADRPTLLLFLRADQDQSRTAIDNAKAALKDLPAVQVLAVLSGNDDPQLAKKFAQGLPWTVLNDPDFALVGQLQVRVWPTSIVVTPEGKELARLRGLPESYARDLGAYLAFATKQIDRKTLDQKLAGTDIVSDSPEQMAERHLQVALRLMEKGLIEQARLELDRGLKLHPADQRIELALARVYLTLDQPQQAQALLEKYNEKSALAGEVGTLKGWALVSLKKWDLAIPTLQAAVRLNPNPSEAYFFMGVAYQAKAQWPQAAAAFRSAFESTPTGRLISLPPQPSDTSTTRKSGD
jgi:tetratricopeptide (TPR) repeat protein